MDEGMGRLTVKLFITIVMLLLPLRMKSRKSSFPQNAHWVTMITGLPSKEHEKHSIVTCYRRKILCL